MSVFRLRQYIAFVLGFSHFYSFVADKVEQQLSCQAVVQPLMPLESDVTSRELPCILTRSDFNTILEATYLKNV